MSTSGLCCGQWSVSVHQWVVLWSVECKCPPVGVLLSVECKCPPVGCVVVNGV